MATIDNKKLIDDIIAGHGYYENDPRVALIVEYTNAYGKQAWGVTWTNETSVRQRRYLEATGYVINPRILWDNNADTK